MKDAQDILGKPNGTLLVPPGHYYSPLIDSDDPWVKLAITEEASPTIAPDQLGVNEKKLERFQRQIARRKNRFRNKKSSSCRYYADNAAFSLSDALALQTVMEEYNPSRYIEIGCGFSSAAAYDIRGANTVMTFIDPRPEASHLMELLKADDDPDIRPCRVQECELSLFRELRENDILFCDTSHVSKTGSDVLDILFRVLPALRPGVLIHFHDIFYPFEYPEMWFGDMPHSWNEAYILRAFLEGNRGYEVFGWVDWAYKLRPELIKSSCASRRGGSFWIRKLPA